jgi:biotin carboxyl carrier protein
MRRYHIKVGKNDYVIDVQEMAADSFRVWIEDNELDVHIAGDQDIAEATITPEIAPVRTDSESVERPKTMYRPPAPETLPPLPMAYQPVSSPSTAGALDLTAPMPGTILSLSVAPGEAVSRGQVLLILEAMKMKNAIKSPCDGVIAEVLAQPGQAVGYGSILLRYGSSSQ